MDWGLNSHLTLNQHSLCVCARARVCACVRYLIQLTVHITIKNFYFAIRLHVSALIGHFLGGNVPRNTCVINAVEDVCEFKNTLLRTCKMQSIGLLISP